MLEGEYVLSTPKMPANAHGHLLGVGGGGFTVCQNCTLVILAYVYCRQWKYPLRLFQQNEMSIKSLTHHIITMLSV